MSTTSGGIPTEQRDIVLGPFPYSDLSDMKNRPLLVISDEDYNQRREDFICCAITSNPKAHRYAIDITNADLESGSLKLDSKVRADKVFTLKQTRIKKRFGKLSLEKSEMVVDKIRDIIEMED